MEESNNAEGLEGSSGEAQINSQGVEKLSSGLLALYKPELERVKKQLLEFTKKQETLLEQLEEENKNFQEVMETTELHDVMATVKACHGKLTNIKREMGVIHERTARLKKRALRLQQAKQREALTRTQQREERLLHEQSLIAEPVRSTTAVGSTSGLLSSSDSASTATTTTTTSTTTVAAASTPATHTPTTTPTPTSTSTAPTTPPPPSPLPPPLPTTTITAAAKEQQ